MTNKMARRKGGNFGRHQKHSDAAKLGWRRRKMGVSGVPQTNKGLGTKHRSIARDAARKAKKPGYRRSKSGHWYAERRSNRSDKRGPKAKRGPFL